MKVYFIGAGPGAKDLITLRGAEIVKRAGMVIWAGSLVNPAILEMAKPDAEKHDSQGLSLEQQAELFSRAKQNGLDVARLHTGDPSVYGAIAEQIAELEKLKIDYEVVPGVSSVFAAAAAINAELTLPDVSQTVIITRRAGKTPVPETENLKSLAESGATLAILLSVSSPEGIREDLEETLGPDCPAAVVYRATWPDQKIIRTTLAKLPDDVKAAGIKKQAIVFIGKVLISDFSRSHLYSQERTSEK